MTAMSVDRLLAMLLGLRYKEIVTLRRTYIILAIVWVVCLVTGLFLSQLPYRPLVPYHNYTTWPGNLSHLVHRDFPRSRSSSGSNTRSWRDTKRRCTMHCRCSQLQLSVMFHRIQGELRSILMQRDFRVSSQSTKRQRSLVLFNSTLNPFLFCWKISEVREAVKQTIRQTICYAEGQTYFNIGMYCFFYN